MAPWFWPPKNGLPWSWAPLNDATKGIQPADYVIFYGRPKSKKSWIVAYLAATAIARGLRVLLQSKEMAAEDMTRRIAACIARIPSKARV